MEFKNETPDEEAKHAGDKPAVEVVAGLECKLRHSIRAYLLLVRSLVDHLERLLDLEETLRDLESMDEIGQAPELDEDDIPCEHDWSTHLTLIDDGDGEFEFVELICMKCCITRPWLSRLDSELKDTEDFDSKEADEWDAYRKHGPDEADDWDSRGGEV